MYIRRSIEDVIIRISSTFPVLLVTGPRQAGKTTLLRHLAEENRKYITLDDPDIRRIAKTDTALFMQRYKPPLITDIGTGAVVCMANDLIPVDMSNWYVPVWLI